MPRARARQVRGDHAASGRRVGAARVGGLAGCGVLLGLFLLLGVVPRVRAAAVPAGARPPGGNFVNPVVRAVDIAEPAVVRIGTEELATLTLQLCSRSVTLPLDGGTYQVAGTGSGAFISANGDILTADHVVDPPDSDVLYFAADDVANVLNHAGQYDPGCGFTGGAVSATDVANGLVQLKFTTHATNKRTVVWLSTAFSGPIDASSLKDAPALDATVVASSSYTQDDLAIVHVSATDTPSIAVGQSADVAVEDMLTVIGFPGNGDVTNSATNMLTPSVNGVMVSALKQNDNGSPLIQVAGNVEHGDSGGPMLDAQGDVVGVVSFAGPDPQGSTTFMRTTSSAQPLISGQQINTAPGHFQLAWSQAFADYAATYPGHWHVAQAKMAALSTAYPQFKALALYLTFARAAAARELTPQPSMALPSTDVLIAGGAAVVVVLLLLVLALLLVARARRKRKARKAAQLAQVGYAPTYPAASPQPYGPPTGTPYAPYGPPYNPGYGLPPGPSQGMDGPQPVVANRLPVGGATPMREAGGSASSRYGLPEQGRSESDWRLPPVPGVPDGNAPGGRTNGGMPPPTWSWGAPQRPASSDAYNDGGGDGFGGSGGY